MLWTLMDSSPNVHFRVLSGKEERMIAAQEFYIAVNVVLGLMCVVSIFLAVKHVPVNGGRNILILALVLLILSGAALSFCQFIFRFYALAYMADVATEAEGTLEKVKRFSILLPIGNILEVVAIGICALVGKKMISLRVAGQSEGGEA
jgi:hypothetical protein